jgi:hypothetical protein
VGLIIVPSSNANFRPPLCRPPYIAAAYALSLPNSNLHRGHHYLSVLFM